MKIIVAIILIAVGVVVRIIAIRTLKGNFSLNIKTPDYLVDTGIYKYMRHPSYVGTMLALAGISLLCIELAFCYLMFMFFLQRVIDEEVVLLTKLKGYLEYWKNTYMFFPFPRRRRP